MSDDDESFDLLACLARVREGDQAAARELVDHLYPLVIRIVRTRVPRRLTEEDLAQEVFMKVFSRLDQYQGAVPLTHWVSRIAVTTCIDALRAQKRRPEFRWADLSENEARVVEHAASPDTGLTAGDALAAREIIDRLLGQLKPTDQLVIRLLDLEQKSGAEISALTGWSTTLIKVRAFRARQKLRKLFETLERKERS
ncbi:RNA polymerase subunit sigma-24 [Cephaloticoccus primus]|uniref:RNA polymerase subunit sigma-24 n=1 Tax=Cephaloticoccus primus TaxID=1548207 RepID=A0A139SPX6_9BACT|nr:RNA polymerase sigma factor [Cephaloticoccus primus]KXU36649.1 RNA polymerase subunit sigma-24 [Cephaloticoccus primus]